MARQEEPARAARTVEARLIHNGIAAGLRDATTYLDAEVDAGPALTAWRQP